MNNFCSAHNKNLKARAQEEQDILDYRMKLLTFSHQKKVDRLEVVYDDDDDDDDTHDE